MKKLTLISALVIGFAISTVGLAETQKFHKHHYHHRILGPSLKLTCLDSDGGVKVTNFAAVPLTIMSPIEGIKVVQPGASRIVQFLGTHPRSSVSLKVQELGGMYYKGSTGFNLQTQANSKRLICQEGTVKMMRLYQQGYGF